MVTQWEVTEPEQEPGLSNSKSESSSVSPAAWKGGNILISTPTLGGPVHTSCIISIHLQNQSEVGVLAFSKCSN